MNFHHHLTNTIKKINGEWIYSHNLPLELDRFWKLSNITNLNWNDEIFANTSKYEVFCLLSTLTVVKCNIKYCLKIFDIYGSMKINPDNSTMSMEQKTHFTSRNTRSKHITLRFLLYFFIKLQLKIWKQSQKHKLSQKFILYLPHPTNNEGSQWLRHKVLKCWQLQRKLSHCWLHFFFMKVGRWKMHENKVIAAF